MTHPVSEQIYALGPFGHGTDKQYAHAVGCHRRVSQMPAPDETAQAMALAVMEMVVVVVVNGGLHPWLTWLPCRSLYAYPYSCPCCPCNGTWPWSIPPPLSSVRAHLEAMGAMACAALGSGVFDCVHAHGVCSPKKVRPLSHLSSPTAPVLLRLGTALQ